MSLTVNKLEKRVVRRLGYVAMPVELPILDVANDAGWWITGLREWNWLLREPALLDLVADQEYIILPDDFGQIVDLQAFEGTGSVIGLTTMQEIIMLRRGDLSGQYGYKGAIVFPTTDVGSEMSPPRLEIWPTPSAAVVSGFSLLYRAGWQKVTNDADHIHVPPWLEMPFVETCVAIAKGSEHDDAGTTEDFLASVTRVLLEAAERFDGTIQGDYGPIENGAGDSVRVNLRTYGPNVNTDFP